MGVASYNLWRESSMIDVYYQIGNVPYDSLSLFTDSTANPCMKIWKYKLSTIDSNGNESVLSNARLSTYWWAYLDSKGYVVFTWYNTYAFDFSHYVIWKRTFSGDLIKIDTIPLDTIPPYGSYIDSTWSPAADTDYFLLEKVLINVCVASNPQTNFTSSLSCRRWPYPVVLSDGLDQNYTKNNTPQLQIYPNPAHDHINIELYLEEKQQINIDIYNSIGAKVYEHTMNGNSGINTAKLDLSDLPDNIYFIQVSMKNKVLIRKIAIIN